MMSFFEFDPVLGGSVIGGAGGLNSLVTPYTFFITSSQDWIAPFSGKVRMWAIGPGGSGASVGLSGLTGAACVATGGGAGGVCYFDEYEIQKGDILTCLIGSGGEGVTSLGAGTNGNAGGSTLITGNNLSLVASGGQGGLFQLNFANGSVLGGSGGTSTGGTENYNGGSGGATLNQSVGVYSATGGGGWSLTGTGGNGGDNFELTVAGRLYATGGGGSVGRGGSNTADALIGATGGGGVTNGGDRVNAASTVNNGGDGYNIVQENYAGYYPTGLTEIYQGGNAVQSSTYGGSGGNIGVGASNASYFGGSGGGCAGSSVTVNTGSTLYGGGTGGSINSNTGGGNARSGTAGNGLFIVQYLEV